MQLGILYHMTYIIGLTGNIGTGKSTVMRLLEELGAETIDADRVAHELMEPGEPEYEAGHAFSVRRAAISSPTPLMSSESDTSPPRAARSFVPGPTRRTQEAVGC